MTDTTHRFNANLKKDARFEPSGLRTYFMDRDLGVAKATGGRVMAEVHRANGTCPAGGGGMHYHTVDFQMNYLLKGWMKVEIEGEGTITFEAGDSWVQPPEIKHNVLDFSLDMEVLEICMPAKFDTTEV